MTGTATAVSRGKILSRYALSSSQSGLATAFHFGNYSLKDIIPGDYRLFAWDDNSSVPYLERQDLETYGSHGHSIHLNEGDRLKVPLNLIPVE